MPPETGYVQLCAYPRCASMPAFYGPSTPPYCEVHAAEVAAEIGIKNFHPHHHEQLRALIEEAT